MREPTMSNRDEKDASMPFVVIRSRHDVSSTLTEDECRTLIRLLRHFITPDREPLLPKLELLRAILEKLEFALDPAA